MKQYLQAVQTIRQSLAIRTDRTGTGTQSVFGHQMRFDLNEGFPLTTTKKTFWKGILRELLWILEGSTNAHRLKEMGAGIWDDWATETGELGPVYGAQWRRWTTHRWVEETQPRTLGALWQEAITKKHFGLANRLGQIAQALAEKNVSLDEFTPPAAAPISAALQEAGIPLTETVSYLREESIDQIANLIHNLKTRPFSRRHVVSAWNPADMGDEGIDPAELARAGKMAVATCHCLFQFYVSRLPIERIRAKLTSEQLIQLDVFTESLPNLEDNTSWSVAIVQQERIYEFIEQNFKVRTKQLSCQLYQRSADFMVGVPFNIASYALLTMMIAQVCDMDVNEFIWTGGDVHIYTNHFEGAATQLQRTPHRLPRMWINPQVKNIDDFKESDFELQEYEHDEAISFDVAR